MSTIAERLKKARDDLGLTQGQLAEKAGVTQGTIANVENSIRKRPRGLIRIAAVLGVRPEWLEDGSKPEKPTSTAAVGEPAKKYGKHSPGWTGKYTELQLTVSSLVEEHLEHMNDDQCKALIAMIETFHIPHKPRKAKA